MRTPVHHDGRTTTAMVAPRSEAERIELGAVLARMSTRRRRNLRRTRVLSGRQQRLAIKAWRRNLSGGVSIPPSPKEG